LRTVPIYWGCPNLKDFFNLDGIIHINDIIDAQNIDTTSLFNQANAILFALETELKDPTNYERRRGAIEQNFSRALQWIHLDKRMRNAILVSSKHELLSVSSSTTHNKPLGQEEKKEEEDC